LKVTPPARIDEKNGTAIQNAAAQARALLSPHEAAKTA